jgi:hypothetical protein
METVMLQVQVEQAVLQVQQVVQEHQELPVPQEQVVQAELVELQVQQVLQETAQQVEQAVPQEQQVQVVQ